MSVHDERLLDLCAGYVLGALDEPESVELEQHLVEGCPECEAELRRLADGVAVLAAGAPPVAPPPALKARVFERVRAEGVKRAARVPDAPRADAEPRRVISLPPRRRSAPWVWGWAAAAVFAATSLLMWQRSEQLAGRIAAARGELDAVRHELTEQQQQLAEERRWSALLESADTRVVDLKLTPQGNAVLRARAIYDAKAHQAMIVFTNFTPPAGSDYELWALRGGPPQSLGLIRADASGRAIVKLPDLGDPARLAAFAVSLEKSGGSTSPAGPEGPVVMVGKLAGS